MACDIAKAALDYANQVGVALYTYDPLGKVTAISSAGQTLMKAGSSRPRLTALNAKQKLALYWLLAFILSIALLVLVVSH